MTRIENWDVALSELIEERRNVPFEWGRQDCINFAFTAVCMMRGMEEPEWLRAYESLAEAKRTLVENGIGELTDVGTEFLQQEPLESVLMARRGDLVFSQGAYGICVGRFTLHPGPDGLVAVPLSTAIIAWRI